MPPGFVLFLLIVQNRPGPYDVCLSNIGHYTPASIIHGSALALGFIVFFPF